MKLPLNMKYTSFRTILDYNWGSHAPINHLLPGMNAMMQAVM